MTTENVEKCEKMIPGVYAGYGWFDKSQDKRYKVALSIGWNPTYNNSTKVIEAFLIDTFANDFYGENLTLEILHFIRAEAVFDDFDTLIWAIPCDVKVTESILE